MAMPFRPTEPSFKSRLMTSLQLESRITRMIPQLKGFYQKIRYLYSDHPEQVLAEINHINFREALYLLSAFPFQWVGPDIFYDEDGVIGLVAIRYLYGSTAIRLHSKFYGVSIPQFIEEVEIYEPYQKLSELRYDLVEQLWKQWDKVFHTCLGSPAFAWLLAESAVCRSMLVNGGFINSLEPREPVSSHRKAYERMKEYCNCLDDFNHVGNDLEGKENRSLELSFARFDQFIDDQALGFAKKDKTFDTHYYKPYVKALRHWNTHSLNYGKMIFLQTPSPRPRVGKRYS